MGPRAPKSISVTPRDDTATIVPASSTPRIPCISSVSPSRSPPAVSPVSFATHTAICCHGGGCPANYTMWLASIVLDWSYVGDSSVGGVKCAAALPIMAPPRRQGAHYFSELASPVKNPPSRSLPVSLCVISVGTSTIEYPALAQSIARPTSSPNPSPA